MLGHEAAEYYDKTFPPVPKRATLTKKNPKSNNVAWPLDSSLRFLEPDL